MIGCIRNGEFASKIILRLLYEYELIFQRSGHQSCISLHSCINHCLLFNSDFIMESMKIY